MVKVTLVVAALAATCAAMGPALADAPPHGYGSRARGWHSPAIRHAHPVRRHVRHGRHHGDGGFVAGPGYGPLPPFFAGTGAAADHLHGTPVTVTVYREAYIGRGLIYNTPPTLDVPGPVLSVRY
jgi:hypothetical protein